MEVGRCHRLRVERRAALGWVLGDGEDEVLLPERDAPRGIAPGQHLEVFVHTDMTGRPVATTERPLAVVGQYAALRVASVTRAGAFLDWGLHKDLLVPASWQRAALSVGEVAVVHVCRDPDSGRVLGTTFIEGTLAPATEGLAVGSEVGLLVYRVTPLGFAAIVAQRYSGLLYRGDVFEPIALGQTLSGFVKRVRDDGKVDVTLRPAGAAARDVDCERLLAALRTAGGHLALSDESTPEEIAERLQLSKKAFKRALGVLYRERRVRLVAGGVELVEDAPA